MHLKQPLTVSARRCLHDLLITGNWRYSPKFHEEMMSVAAFARVILDGPAHEDYIFVMHDFSFCGTAGCSMLIGEVGNNGICDELYDGAGFTHAIAVLRKRDQGYHRLYTPCELRFDSHEYQQIHEECLLGWGKRLADQAVQDHMGQPDLEFAWIELRRRPRRAGQAAA